MFPFSPVIGIIRKKRCRMRGLHSILAYLFLDHWLWPSEHHHELRQKK